MYNPRNIKAVESRDLNHLHPEVKKMAELFIKEANEILTDGWSVKVISTLRTFKEQDDLYAQGRTKPGKIVTNARGGYSIHNWGCAIDIGVFKDGKYNPKGYKKKYEEIYKKVSVIGKSIGFRWGGDFKKPVDMPHYEYTGRYTSKDFCRLAIEGKSIDSLIDRLGDFLKNKGLI